MINMRSVFVVLIALTICCVSAVYAVNTVAQGEETLKVEKVSLPKVPDFLMSVYYDADDIYIPEVICFNESIDKAKHVIVSKRLYDRPLWGKDPLYFFYNGTFISRFDENIDKLCNAVSLVKSAGKYDRFAFYEYDAGKYINYIDGGRDASVFSVVKDRGKVIWYFEGERPGDIAITNDGRYMIATAWSVFYVDTSDERIISEMYSGNRVYMTGSTRPDNVRILTDNIVRVGYPNGRVEHWKVRLSEDDIEKNLKKYNKEEKHLADKCLLWSNGKKGTYTASQKMWCYYESDSEPVYDNTNLADITADLSDLQNSVLASAAKQTNENAAAVASGNGLSDEAATGRSAGLVARIKTFFARLFS